MKIYEIEKQAIERLEEAGIKEAQEKVKILMLHFFKMTKEQYSISKSDEAPEKTKQEFFLALNEVIKGEPAQYITNEAEFMGRKYYVDEHVLIPRLDTEILVEKAIDVIRKNNIKTVLEIGTGSGIIGITISKMTDAKVVATDISEKTLEIAKKNAIKNEVDFERYKLVKSDIYENIGERYDLIISNPPYIKKSEIENLDEDVKREPTIALNGGYDGLDYYRKIIYNSAKHINGYSSFILFEIGFDQAKDVSMLLNGIGWEVKEILKDFEGRDRVVVAEI